VEPSVVVKRRERRVEVSDGGTAIALAGTPPGWRDVARRIELEYCVNVSRHGKVFLPVSGRFSVEEIEERIAGASRALYHDLLDLGGFGGIPSAERVRSAPSCKDAGSADSGCYRRD
jgi:hypothetical protein